MNAYIREVLVYAVILLSLGFAVAALVAYLEWLPGVHLMRERKEDKP